MAPRPLDRSDPWDPLQWDRWDRFRMARSVLQTL